MSTDNTTKQQGDNQQPDGVNPTETQNTEDYEQDKNWKALREQAKKEKEERKALEAKIAKYEKAEEERKAKELEAKGEYEKLIQLEKEKYQKQQAKILEEKLQAKMEAELIKNGANPNMAELLVGNAVKQAQLDDDGNVTNLNEIVENAKTKYKDVFKPTQKKTPTATNPAPKQFDNSPTGVSKMSFNEYLEYRKSQG